MFEKTITLFNHYKSRLGDMWYPSVIKNVHFTADRAAIVKVLGSDSKDNAMLNIHYQLIDGKIYVGGKPYLPPKEWDGQTNDKLAESLTFSAGQYFDFFIVGEYESTSPISDDDYTDGFYNYMNSKYDDVYAITSVGMYSVIPSIQIMGA